MLEVVRGLRGRGHRVVVTYSQAGPLLSELQAAGAELQECPAPVVRKANLRPAGFLALIRDVGSGLPKMRKLIRRVNPDVLYVNTLTIPVWSALARLARVPVVLHVHEAEAGAPAVARWGLNAPTALVDLIIYNSQASKGVGAQGLGRNRPSMVIRNGVSGPDRMQPAREHLDDGVRLVYLGRLSPRKGVDVAIRALAELRVGGLPASLTLVGAVFPGYEWYEQQLRELVESESLQQCCTFAGFQTQVWPWLTNADIALVPSITDEPFGNTVIEAVLAARPVVASDHTGLREAREGLTAAVAVPAGDPAAVARAVRGIIADWPQMRECALRDSRFAASRYAPSRFQDDVVAAIERVAVGSAG